MLHLIKYYSCAAASQNRSRPGLWWPAPSSTLGRHRTRSHLAYVVADRVSWRQGRHALLPEMALRVVPRRIVHERLAEKHLDLVVRPALGREGLQVHDDPLDMSQRCVSPN